ncbi:SH3 domain-containing protein [Sphingomonas sp. S2-65]|uniref:SH3 domain-containing protein n=1 Tax=Sphingomonas sp. S2-65 TaxID=2903960 RepID=UPI001F484127|nr:SH3 domain-containing protein [Sphingomonas sp. S2-65]UYY59148.1 SH3 domain-containing protein [Sphingomonas sp. S2-65]
MADVRLAERVFAPHYAAPLLRELIKPAELRATASLESDVMAHLASGEPFEVLEFAGVHAWGISPNVGLVGYISADALAGTVE